MYRSIMMTAAAAVALTAVAADAKPHRHMAMSKRDGGSAATRDLNNKQLGMMDTPGSSMSSGAMSNGAMSNGAMSNAPAGMSPSDSTMTNRSSPSPTTPAPGAMDPQQPK